MCGEMNHYLIDGNNLIGRIKSFQRLQKKDKQASREQLVNLLNKYFRGKKIKLTLHFDGYPNLPLSITKGKIEYSKNEISDNLIRREIESSKNSRLLILITSDHSLMNFGKVCGCTIISSEDFYKNIEQSFERNDEDERIKQLSGENDEFFKIFQAINSK